MISGYARVSTINQDLSIQRAALTAAGCTVVRSEKVTGGEIILLDIMFDLPSLEGVKEVMISKQVIEGTALPLYIYADHAARTENAFAHTRVGLD
jgi:ATP-dependent Clp protease ATP-binding subunit ClpX